MEEALRKQNQRSHRVNVKIRDVAYALREAIMNSEKTPLPDNLTIEDIANGEVNVPEIVTQFFQHLICGPDSRRWQQSMKQRRIKSISQDVVFATTSGQKKPRKHLELGLTLKSLTGSRKVVEMINRLGHCVNYHTVQELETELTFEATRSNIKTPFGMNLTNNCGTGIAWDNFDRFVETQSGRDTLHDTVGIAYQVIPKCYKEQHPVENIPATDNYTEGNTPQ